MNPKTLRRNVGLIVAMIATLFSTTALAQPTKDPAKPGASTPDVIERDTRPKPRDQDPASTEAKFDKFSFKPAEGPPLYFGLLKPAKEPASGSRVPLVVWLHWQSGKGDDNSKQLVGGSPVFLAGDAGLTKYPCYVVAPQCPSNSSWVGGDFQKPGDAAAAKEASKPMHSVMRLVEKLKADYPGIDPDRVYFTGYSMGGFGVLDAAALWPDRVAAVMMGGAYRTSCDSLKKTPILMCHGKRDELFPIQKVQECAKKLGDAWCYSGLIVIEQADHGIAHDDFWGDERYYKWLFSHSRGKPGTCVKDIPKVEPPAAGSKRIKPDDRQAQQADKDSVTKPFVFENAAKSKMYFQFKQPARDDVKAPLVIVLHGEPERGDDNRKQLTVEPAVFLFERHGSAPGHGPRKGNIPDAYYVVPQCPPGLSWTASDWKTLGDRTMPLEPSKPMAMLMELIDELKKSYKIDQVYVVGHSMGGSGALELAMRRPAEIAGALVTSATVYKDCDKLKDVPIQWGHASEDKIVPIAKARLARDRIGTLGGKIDLEEVVKGGHEIKIVAFWNNGGRFAWLFSQHK